MSAIATRRLTRAELREQYQPFVEEGYTHAEIAEIFGKRRSSVAAVFSDPDGAKQRKRRERYQGVCCVCGGPTTGSEGAAKAPDACRQCAPALAKIWTEDAIIAAIQRWAAEHGRPPRAIADWLSAAADGSHPCMGSVYGPGAPFASWADAIEAAGFPRPRAGYYQCETLLGIRRVDIGYGSAAPRSEAA